MVEKLHGIFTPNMVPLDPSGQINESELRRYIDWLIERGVHGLFPNGSTGEFTRFTADERRRIIRIVCDQTAGRVPILAGAAEVNVSETLRACETYAEYGARAAAIVAPFYFKLSAESVFAYYRELARHSPIDLLLYNIPIFASPIDVPTICRLAELDRVIGIKDSSGDLTFMMRMMDAVKPVDPSFVFLAGWEAILLPCLVMGVDGGTHASGGVVPELFRKLYDLARNGQIEEAKALQFGLLELFDTMVDSVDFPEGIRAAVALRGFEMGPGRQPTTDVQQQQLAELRARLQKILAKLGVPHE